VNKPDSESSYRWYILILAALTNTLASAVPSMCLPVLFKDISRDLNLSLVEVGLIWGIAALPGIFTSLAGGAIGDRFGPKRILSAGCLLVGVVGGLRGLANNFTGLAAAVFLVGFLTPFVGMNVIKTCGIWFASRQLVLANGVLSLGMALGFVIGSLASDTLLSPWLGGWRNVLFFYGALTALLSIPWLFTRPAPASSSLHSPAAASSGSLRQALAHVMRIKNVWLLGLAILGIGGCIQGALGYIPLYLRGMGWSGITSDGALASFHSISMLCVIPIALWSPKLGSPKKVMIGAALMVTLGIGLLSVVDGVMVWVAVCLAGMVRDGFMAVFLTSITETEGIGPAYAGTAAGLVMVFSSLGSLLAPPLGNSLAAFGAGLPFLFWAGLTMLGIMALYATQARKIKSVLVTG
jgi:MFS family permease